VETPRKFITAKLSIRKPGSSSVLIIWMESFAVINLRGGFHKQKVLYVLSPCKPTKNLG
jgi:hypothetical protein